MRVRLVSARVGLLLVLSFATACGGGSALEGAQTDPTEPDPSAVIGGPCAAGLAESDELAWTPPRC